MPVCQYDVSRSTVSVGGSGQRQYPSNLENIPRRRKGVLHGGTTNAVLRKGGTLPAFSQHCPPFCCNLQRQRSSAPPQNFRSTTRCGPCPSLAPLCRSSSPVTVRLQKKQQTWDLNPRLWASSCASQISGLTPPTSARAMEQNANRSADNRLEAVR